MSLTPKWRFRRLKACGIQRFGASGMIGIVRSPRHRASATAGTVLCGFVMDCASARLARIEPGVTMPSPDKQLSAEQSRQIADTIREEIARRRISRQSLAELAKLSLSTLEKVLGGRRPFTLATTVRLEQALGVSLRKTRTLRRPPRPRQRRHRARWTGRLFAPRGGVDRRDLCHGASVVRRQGRDLCLPHRDRLGRGGVIAGVSRKRTAGRGLHPVRRGGGAEPVGPHLSRHQPARPASPDHRGAAGDFGRDVRHHHDAARRAAARC